MKRILTYVGAVFAMLLTACVLYPDAVGHLVHHATPSLSLAYNWLSSHALGGGATGVTLASFGFPVKPYTRAQLEILSGPQRASDLEVIPHVLFDTQSFASASTLSLRFFSALPATPDLGNMEAAGSFPDPCFFQPYFYGCDPLILPAVGVAATVVGPWDDMQRLVLTSRPVISFAVSSKPYLVGIPLSFLHTSGGAVGGVGFGTSTTGHLSANNSVPDGGWRTQGSFIIPPKQAISCLVTWPATVTLNATPVNMRLWMAGNYFRRVL